MGEIVFRILGLGLSGFGFLLMYLAFKLIRDISRNSRDTHDRLYRTINSYMVLCFLMTIVVGTFTYLDADRKKEKIATLERLNSDNVAIIKKQQQDLTTAGANLQVLSGADQYVKLIDSAASQSKKINSIEEKISNDIIVATINKQKNFVDTLAKLVVLNGNSQEKLEFGALAKAFTKYNDSLKGNLQLLENDNFMKTYLQKTEKVTQYGLQTIPVNAAAVYFNANAKGG